MNQSFYNGIAGVKTHQFGLDVWANNIANINTIGFKYNIPEFSTIFERELLNKNSTPISNDIGVGSTKVSSVPNMSMGSLVSTDSKFDLAIAGKGWFGVKGVSDEKFFTRDGSFFKDKNGDLVDSRGNFVLGKSANNIKNNIITDDSIDDININSVADADKINLPENLEIPAKQTTFVKFKGNLDAKIQYSYDENGQIVEVPNIEVFRTIIYNKDGAKRYLDVIFTKEVPHSPVNVKWDAKVSIKDIKGNIITSKEGKFLFDGTGALVSHNLSYIENDGIKIKLDFGSFVNDTNFYSGRDGLTSYTKAQDDGKNIIRDGYSKGLLNDYAIDEKGNIQAIFTNGKSVPIYKLMIFNFKNDQGLERVTSKYYKETANSGKISLIRNKDGEVINPNIKNGYIETSNVDLQTAMTELIVMQKAFDANSKSITTSDQLIQNAINMKK